MFGRKAREELLKAQLEILQIRAEREKITEIAEKRGAELYELRNRIHDLEVANAVYKERLDLITQMPQFSAEPRDLSASEEREDLEYALQAGLLDQDQFKAELEAAGLLNTEVDFAAEDYPRLGGRAR